GRVNTVTEPAEASHLPGGSPTATRPAEPTEPNPGRSPTRRGTGRAPRHAGLPAPAPPRPLPAPPPPGRCRPAGAGPPASGGDGRPTRPRGDLPGRGGLPSRRRPAGRAGLAGPSTGPSPPRGARR